MKMSIHKKDKCPLCGELKDVRSKRCRRKHKTPEEICEKRKEWAKNNRERIRKAQQKYRETHREECRQRTLKHRHEHPGQYKKRQKKFMVSRLRWLHEYKHERGCLICGENDPRCLDFHHRDPKQKVMGVALMVGLQMERLIEEINKCDVMCANCHRKKTNGRYDLAG